ncbi:hypothetical protein ABZ901_23470 [Actinacidiphila alni]|uniref:hypothetical protein n=1 Tax=Actinacidiphila alni TaxID=380248 RepID=UPI0033D72331
MLNLRAEQRPPHAPDTAEGSGGPDGGHHTSVVERGAFAVARCTCGWKGPARRARDRARRDADEHVAG